MASAALSSSAQYRPIAITGYATDPADTAITKIGAADLSGITASSNADLESKIAARLSALIPDDAKISVTVTTADLAAKTFTATVEVTFGYTTRTATVTN